MENKIEFYEGKHFMGRKLVLTTEAPSLKEDGFNGICSSVRVRGPGSWHLYEHTNYEGWCLKLETGEYPDLSAYNGKNSVKPAWNNNHLKPSETPGVTSIPSWELTGAWFLGAKAENQALFTDLAVEAFDSHREYRQRYFPVDKRNVGEEIKSSKVFQEQVVHLKQELRKMCTDLQQSVPYQSARYQAHMAWETTMAANLGYLAALLYNQNNCSPESSPVTTLMEIEVAEHLCKMIGYNTIDQHDPLIPVSWGHLTSGGTVANLEALWASRNLKFYPLAVQKALLVEPELHEAVKYEVMVPCLGEKKPLVDVSQWDLLNLDIDDVIRMATDVQTLSGVPQNKFSSIIKKCTLQSLGFMGFQRMNKFQDPVVFAPSNSHYSWSKAMAVLGFGDANLLQVPLDEHGRQDVQELKLALEDSLSKQVPVVAVVVVIGSTAEGAVDPLYEILEIRKEMRLKGLDFAVLADAAWGGYFLTMLNIPSPEETQHEETDFILPLNHYIKKQLVHLRYCDTVTLDPHKCGFVPYPGGSLCYRNGQMKGFVKITSPIVHTDEQYPTVSAFGIEGSRPGAPAASCLLSHRVIGLDKHGYGRILGQIMFAAKLNYCMWMTVAKDDDPFLCVSLIPLRTNWSMEKSKQFIRERILGKSTWEVAKDIETLHFLMENGPDLLINSFAVNLKNNSNPVVHNQLNLAIFNQLSHRDITTKNVYRVPLFLTTSELLPGHRQDGFRQRLGLRCDTNEDQDLVYLVNTVMNPWQTSITWIKQVGEIFRNCVLNSIGEITDKETLHGFVIISAVSTKNEVYVDYLPSFNKVSSQYQAVAKLKIADPERASKIRQYQKSLSSQPLFLRSVKPSTIHKLMQKSSSETFRVELFDAFPVKGSIPCLDVDVEVNVIDVPRFQHFDLAIKHYPKHMTYWLFGDAEGIYLSHVITKQPDFQQVVKLDNRPQNISMELIDLGIPIHITSLPGEPLTLNGEIVDPLQNKEYTVQFTGEGGSEMKTVISVGDPHARVLFNHVTI